MNFFEHSDVLYMETTGMDSGEENRHNEHLCEGEIDNMSLYIGTNYHPHDWPRERWNVDV